MSDKYVLATDDNGDLAIRTVTAEESPTANSTDIITATTDGKLAVRVVGSGGGGSDPHNLGFYADLTALQTAHPTGSDGDFAILGSTDTVWVWDSGTSAWKDTDTKGQVTSVNNKTGAVTLGINDVAPTQTGKSGYVLGTDGFVAGWVKPEIVQVSALPAASEDEVDNIYQFVGTTDANYTNGYFYKCVSDGATPAVYSWEAVEVQASSGGLPDQTGQSGKFLTTDGTDASWSDKPLVDKSTGSHCLSIGKEAAASNNSNTINIGDRSYGTCSSGVAIGYGTVISGDGNAVAVGSEAEGGGFSSVAYGRSAKTTSAATGGIAIGAVSTSSAYGAIQIGFTGTNSNAGTMKVALKKSANDSTLNVTLLDSDGTIPTDRLVHAINKYSTMPTAASTNLGWIVQFTGTTDSTYTHGHLYECVSDGGNPATYSWTEVSMGGGSSYTAGTGIDITNNTISVASPIARLELASGNTVGSVYGMWAKTTTISPYRCLVLGHDASMGSTSANGAVVLGAEAVGGNGTVSVGARSSATVADGIAIGNAAKSTSSGAVQIGYGTNSTSNTFQWQSYRLVSSDGTIPTARLTKVNSTITLAAADWSSNTQTVTVNGVTSTSVVLVAPDPSDTADYVAGGILCTAQGTNSLTFTCSTTPANDIDVVIVAM